MTQWHDLAARLSAAIHLKDEPIAITFSSTSGPAGVAPFDDPMPPASADGRTGRVPAGCVFWIKAADRTFTTVAEDHANCSVGSMTHGFKTLEEVADNGDVATLLESGWVTMDMVPKIPVVTERPATVVVGPGLVTGRPEDALPQPAASMTVPTRTAPARPTKPRRRTVAVLPSGRIVARNRKVTPPLDVLSRVSIPR